jgi:hypothetical protein
LPREKSILPAGVKNPGFFIAKFDRNIAPENSILSVLVLLPFVFSVLARTATVNGLAIHGLT